MATHKENTECCPPFDPQKWNEKTFVWESKQFITTSIPLLFHIPFPPMIAKKITKMWRMAEESGKTPPEKADVLLLFTDPHPFKSELYLSVTGPVKNAKNVEISGKFLSNVYEGPYNFVPKFMKEMDQCLARGGKKAKKYYVHYAYCPKCAKEYGHNYMILFAQI